MAKKEIVLPVTKAKVTLKDPKELKVKDRKKVYANAASAEQGIMQALSLTDGLIAIMVESWDLELPIPSIKISVLDEMEMADYDFLTEQTKDAQKVLFPALTETDETVKDVDSPFGNSNGSNG